MKKLIIILFIFSCCTYRNNNNKIDEKHIESLAKDFMRSKVVPQMRDPKPYEVVNAKVIVRSVADMIGDYQYSYDHMSFNHEDSLGNKRLLDSVLRVSTKHDSILEITVNVSYKTKYRRGDVVTDSIKLGYNVNEDKISYWPF